MYNVKLSGEVQGQSILSASNRRAAIGRRRMVFLYTNCFIRGVANIHMHIQIHMDRHRDLILIIRVYILYSLYRI